MLCNKLFIQICLFFYSDNFPTYCFQGSAVFLSFTQPLSRHQFIFSLHTLVLHYIIYDHTSISEPRFCKEDHDTHFIASIFDQFVALLTFPFGNKFFNSFRDSGLPNVTERRKENHFLLIYSMMSKNSKSVNKYISIIQCILT